MGFCKSSQEEDGEVTVLAGRDHYNVIILLNCVLIFLEE